MNTKTMMVYFCVQKAVPPTPWKSILLSRPQWASTLAHFSFNWSYYTLIINVPLYLKETFAYVITEVSTQFILLF